MSNRFAATTWGCVILGIVACVVLALLPPRELSAWLAPGLGVFLFAVFFFVWGAYRPKSFEVSSGGLTIRWPWRSRTVARGGIRHVRRVTKADLGWMVRICGAGGFLGGFGRFRSGRLGHLDAYVSDRQSLVLIDLAGPRPLLISPERPDEFVGALRAVATGGQS